MDLHIALGASLIATKGYAAPEVEQTYLRARQLCAHLDDPHQLFSVLRGLWNYYLVCAELQTAHALGEQLLALAQQAQDTAMLVAAHRALGVTLFHLGAVAAAYTHSAQGMALYDPQQHRASAFLYGEDAGVMCHSLAAWELWYLGYPDQGLTRSQRSGDLAQQIAHPFSLGFALGLLPCSISSAVRCVLPKSAPKLLSASPRNRDFRTGWRGAILCGWALAQQGQAQEGIEQITPRLKSLSCHRRRD